MRRPPAEQVVELGGRVCYMSFGKGRKSNQEYIGNILEAKHGSVIEHAVWTFLIAGVSRSLTHELVRHRAGFSFSQLSQRYVDETTADFVEPDAIAANPEAHALFEQAVAGGPGGLCRAGGVARRAVYRRAEQDAAAQDGPPGGAGRAAQRHRDQDRRHGQRPRLAPLHRDARQRLRRAGDPQAGDHDPAHLCKQEAPNLFGDYEICPAEDGSEVAVTPHAKV